MRILVKVDAFHKGEPTKAGTVIEVDDLDAVRWIREQTGVEWRSPRICPSKNLGKILGVNPLDLKLPKEWYVTVQHLHVGNSKKRRRKGSQFATNAIVRLCDGHRVIGEYMAIPRKGDRPNRATGVQVAVGRAIVLAFADSTSWTAGELLSNRTTWRRFSGEAQAFMREPGNENTCPVFTIASRARARTPASVHAHARAPAPEGLDEDDKGVDAQFRKLATLPVTNLVAGDNGNDKTCSCGANRNEMCQVHGDDGIQSAINPFRDTHVWSDGRRQVAWARLSNVQVRQARELFMADLKHIPTLRECALHEYIIKGRRVIGIVQYVPAPTTAPESTL